MHDKDKSGTPQPTVTEESEKAGQTSPAHWQGEPVPHGHEQRTQDIGFDQRGAGRARQYGRAGALGKKHNDQERRPTRGPARPDPGVLEGVRNALDRSAADTSGVSVTVSEGVVRLSGRVNNYDDKVDLEQRVANCSGVVQVLNQLEPDSPSGKAGN